MSQVLKTVVEREERLEAGVRTAVFETLECGHHFVCRPPAQRKDALRRRCLACEKEASWNT